MRFLVCLLFSRLLLATPMSVPTEKCKGHEGMRHHPGYYPFISYLDFRNISDHIIDQSSESFDPESVRQGDIIYMNFNYLEWFQKKVHDRIKYPYILVTGDVGAFEPRLSMKKLLHDPKLAAWFCRNMAYSYHPKLFQIPFGQDLTPFNASLEAKNELVVASYVGTMPKKHLLYMSHYPRKFGDRDKIVKMFENEPYCFSRNHSDREWGHTPRPLFYEDMMSSYFVISPIGLEADCVRTWEAMVLDCIPIVEHSFLDPLYEGLPIVKVHDWTEINEEFLERKYKEVAHVSREKGYFDYWKALVKKTQEKIQRNEIDFSRLEATRFKKQDLANLKALLKEKGGQNSRLLYVGALTTVRSMQVAELSFLSKVFVCDALLDKDTLKDFKGYLKDQSYLKHKDKLSLIEFDKDRKHLYEALQTYKDAPIFLDLTYFRAAVRPDRHNFRHHLKEDLKKILEKKGTKALLCGNMAEDEYVKKVLDKIESELGVTVKKKGSFWYLKN